MLSMFNMLEEGSTREIQPKSCRIIEIKSYDKAAFSQWCISGWTRNNDSNHLVIPWLHYKGQAGRSDGNRFNIIAILAYSMIMAKV